MSLPIPRLALAAIPAAALMSLVGAVPAAAAADQQVAQCPAVIGNGPGNSSGTLASRDQANNGDGTFTLRATYRPRVARRGASASTLDCAWADADHDGVFQSGEPMFGVARDVTADGGGTMYVQVTVAGTQDDYVCFRLGVADGRGSYTSSANTECVVLTQAVQPRGDQPPATHPAPANQGFAVAPAVRTSATTHGAVFAPATASTPPARVLPDTSGGAPAATVAAAGSLTPSPTGPSPWLILVPVLAAAAAIAAWRRLRGPAGS